MNIFDLQAKISLDASEFNTGIEQASTAMGTLGGGVSAKTIAMGNLVAGAVTTAASDLVDFGKDAIQTGINFDSAMSTVKAISGATGEEFDALRDKAKQMGATTAFTATEAAEAFSYMAMAGWKTEDMLSGIEGIMNLAAASGEDLAATSDIVTDALTAFGLSAEDSGHFANVLAAASSNANTNVGMMGETFKYAAPVAGALGFSIEDTAQAIGLMANAGIKGSQAGTALRSIFNRLAKPTKESATAMGILGISLDDAEGNMKSLGEIMKDIRDGFSGQLRISTEEYAEEVANLNEQLDAKNITQSEYGEALEILEERLNGSSESLQARFAALLGGQEAMSGLLAIVNASEEDFGKLADAIGVASEAAEGQGVAFEMAQTQLDNLGGKVTIFQSALDGFKTAVYDNFSAPLSDAVESVTEFLSALTTGLEAGGVEGAIGAVSELFTTKFPEIASVVEQAVGPVEDFFGAFQSAGSSVIDSISESVGGFIEKFNESSIGEIIGDIAESAGNLFEAFKSAGETIIDGVAKGVGNFFEIFDESLAVSTLESIAEAVKKFFEPFSASLGDWIDKIASGISDVAGFIGDFAGALTNEVVALVKDIADSFESWAPWVAAVAAGFVTMQVITTVAAGIKTLKTALAGAELATKAYELAQAALNVVMNANPIMLVVSAIAALVTGLVVAYNTNEDFRNAVDKAWAAIKEGISIAGEALKTFFTETLPGTFNKIVDWFKGLPEKFVSFGKDIVEGLKRGINDAWSALTGWIGEKIDGLVSGVKDFFGIHSPSTVFAGIGENLVEGLAVGWGSEFEDLEREVGKDMESLTGTAKIGFGDSAIGKSSAAGITSLLTANSGASSQPVEVNLVLDGEVAAKVLYDPLRNVAWQKGKAEAVYA